MTRNSTQVAVALVVSSVLALAGRLLVARVLGREQFGVLSFVEGVSIVAAIGISVGVSGLVRREVAVDSSLVKSIARPVRWIQIVSGLAMSVGLGAVFALTSGDEQALLALVLGLGQLALVLGRVDAAYLEAGGDVRVLTVVTVATRAIWLGLVIALVAAGVELMALPIAIVAAESLRVAWLMRATQARFGRLRRVPLRNGLVAIRHSVPYLFSTLNVFFLGWAVLVVVGLFGTDDAVGLLSSAELAIALPVLLLPILVRFVDRPWPTTGGRSRLLWQRASQTIDAVAVPVVGFSIVIYGFGGELVEFAVGAEFAEAGLAVELLALWVPAAYFTQIVGAALIAAGRTRGHTRLNLGRMTLVIVLVTTVLSLVNTDNDAHVAAWAAGALCVGEWMTVLWISWIRPLSPMRGSTIATLVVLVATAAGLAVIDSGPFDPAWAALSSVAVMTALAAVPRTVTELRSTGRHPDLDPDGTVGAAADEADDLGLDVGHAGRTPASARSAAVAPDRDDRRTGAWADDEESEAAWAAEGDELDDDELDDDELVEEAGAEWSEEFVDDELDDDEFVEESGAEWSEESVDDELDDDEHVAEAGAEWAEELVDDELDDDELDDDELDDDEFVDDELDDDELDDDDFVEEASAEWADEDDGVFVEAGAEWVGEDDDELDDEGFVAEAGGEWAEELVDDELDDDEFVDDELDDDELDDDELDDDEFVEAGAEWVDDDELDDDEFVEAGGEWADDDDELDDDELDDEEYVDDEFVDDELDDELDDEEFVEEPGAEWSEEFVDDELDDDELDDELDDEEYVEEAGAGWAEEFVDDELDDDESDEREARSPWGRRWWRRRRGTPRRPR